MVTSETYIYRRSSIINEEINAASKSMLVHDSEIEGNKMHGSENEGKHMVVKMRGMKCMGKETEGRKLKVMGGPPPPGGQD